MTPRFPYSRRSLARLATCDERLQRVFADVAELADTSILCGHRGEAEQRAAFEDGFSKLNWPRSKHNKTPSLAVDAAPYPVDWHDRERFCIFAGLVIAVAHRHGVPLRWGGDWNGNLRTSDERFTDLVHFEIEEARHG